MLPLPPSEYVFPDPLQSDDMEQGLIAVGADLSASTLIEAYKHGLFPWFNEGDPICWWSPNPRCIIQPQHFKASKSLLRNMRKYNYQIKVNTQFSAVIKACAAPRSYSDQTWISDQIINAYIDLHHKQYAYSIEVWDQELLLGGLYGLKIGAAFFGESMFSRQTDCSKMAFYFLMLLSQHAKFDWVDCQLENDHLLSLGASTISRQQFLTSLKDVLQLDSPDWSIYQHCSFETADIATYGKDVLAEF